MGCATTTGAIQFSNQKKSNRPAIYIDGNFLYKNTNDTITKIPEGNHHIIVRHPNKTLLDTTLYISDEWSIQKNSRIILGTIISTSLLFIPIPSIIPYILFPQPIIFASVLEEYGVTHLNINNTSPVLSETESAIAIQITPDSTVPPEYYPLHKDVLTTKEFCFDKNAPVEPLIWAYPRNNFTLYAIPRKFTKICKIIKANSFVYYDSGPQYEAILEEHLCPQL